MEQRPQRVIGIVFSILGGVFLALSLMIALLGLHLQENVLFFLVLLPFLIVGGVFFTIGQVFLARIRKKRREKEELLAMGNCISAEIVGVERNTMIRINGRCPYRVRCRYHAPDGTVHEFQSADIDYDPTGLFLRDTVDVYIDRYDMDRYHVDLERVLMPLVRH